MKVERKFEVFISSFCRGKYTYVRKALKKMIEDTGLANAYVFESELGSSKMIESAYLDEVARCDVFVLLVDNAEPIEGATLSEYNCAKNLNKKMLCFFCDETERTKTETQKEIEELGNCKYVQVHCFSDIPATVFDTLLEDLVSNYRTVPVKDIKQDIKPELIQKVSITLDRLPKKLFKEYGLFENSIADRLFGENHNEKMVASPINELLKYFFDVALCDAQFDTQKFNELKKLILEKHTEPIKSLIEIRLEVFEYYYADDLDACINSLNKAVSYIKENSSIAEWLLNDVAIDLINIINIRSYKQRKYDKNNEGQRIIEESEGNVIFPELDRIAVRISKNSNKCYKKIELQSPYTTSFMGYHEVFKDLSLYFCVTILYGSITHFRLLPVKCAELLLPLCLETNDISFYAEYIKSSIISNEYKDLDEALRIANINTRIMPFINVEKLLMCIQYMPISLERNISRINALKYFGYYYSDSIFSTEESWFFSYIASQDVNKILGNINQLVFDTIKKCIHRFSQNKIVEYCVSSIQSKNALLIQDCLALAYNIDFSKVSDELQNRFKIILVNNVYKSEFWGVIIQFGYKCTIDWDDLKDAVKDRAPYFFANQFSLEFVFTEKTDFYSQISKCVSMINKRNEEQGNPGVKGYSDDLYSTIWNIVRLEKLQLTWEELIPILSACEETILAKKQVPDAKIKAMLLVLNLKNNYPCARWASWGDSIFKNQDGVISASYIDLFDKTSYCSVAFTYELFKYYFDKENEFTMQLLSLPIVNSYDIIVCLKLLNDIDFRLKDKLSDEMKVAILQLAITLSTHKEVDIRFHAVRLLIWLTDTGYRQQALRRLSQCFDNGNVEIKATILYRIQEIHGDSSIVSYIKQKALVDPNYWVRSIIKKDV